MPEFYARPVFFSRDVARAKRFYIETLGFQSAWDRGDVLQVNRGDLELILSEHEPARVGSGRLFIEPMPNELTAFEAQVRAGAIAVDEVVWGYRCYLIRDPDGNELFISRDI